MEAASGVHYLWVSNGDETRFLRAYIETSKGRETGRSDKNRLVAGALRHRCERKVRTVMAEPYPSVRIHLKCFPRFQFA